MGAKADLHRHLWPAQQLCTAIKCLALPCQAILLWGNPSPPAILSAGVGSGALQEKREIPGHSLVGFRASRASRCQIAFAGARAALSKQNTLAFPNRTPMRLFPFLLLLGVSLSSEGDELPAFQSCIRLLSAKNIGSRECRYRCMRMVCSRQSCSTIKFYGKWNFVRILGMQEPAAVLFSLGNAAACYLALFRSKGHSRELAVLGGFCIQSWVSAAVFHVADTKTTEAIDYFSALWFCLLFFYYSLTRAFSCRGVKGILRLGLLGFYIFHCRQMLLFFDYGRHVLVSSVFMAGANLLWLLRWVREGRPEALRPVPSILVLTAISVFLFQARDFPPMLEIFDSHALWHLSTIPITWMWFRLFRSCQ